MPKRDKAIILGKHLDLGHLGEIHYSCYIPIDELPRVMGLLVQAIETMPEIRQAMANYIIVDMSPKTATTEVAPEKIEPPSDFEP